MIEYYKRKSDFHFEQYQIAFDSGKEKAAAFHQQEYLNYQEMLKQQEEYAGQK